jgi:Tol biopolymer transport system component
MKKNIYGLLKTFIIIAVGLSGCTIQSNQITPFPTNVHPTREPTVSSATDKPTIAPTSSPSTEPILPSDFGTLAFVSIGPGYQGIDMISGNNGKLTTIINDPKGFFFSPSWSPDGLWLAYIYEIPGEHSNNIFKVNIKSKQVVQLTFDSSYKANPSWSPDGKSIIYSAGIVYAKRDIYVLNLESENIPEKLTDSKYSDDFPAWSPDSQKIAFLRFDQDDYGQGAYLYIMDANGNNPHPITDFLAWSGRLGWSPDGKVIAFRSSDQCGDIYKINLEGGDPQQLTDFPGGEKDPVWSPDSKFIVFVASPFQCNHTGGGEPLLPGWQIYMMKSEGGDVYPLISRDQFDFFGPVWSPIR